MKRWRVWGAAVTFAVLTAVLLGVAQLLLVPRDRTANPEAFLLHDYMDAEVMYDEVVFLRDCEVYESFSPVTLWQTYGIEARVCGTPQQLLWHSYAVLSQVFERSSPRVVVLGVYGLIYGEPQSEAYHRMALDALPMSSTKWEVARVGAAEGELALSHIFPLLRYHDRWSQLKASDIAALWEEPLPVSSRGYLVQTDVVAADQSMPDHEGALPSVRTDFGEMALHYLDRIVSLCRQNGASLVLIKAPTDSWRYPWYDEYEQQVQALAEAYDIPYYNLLALFDEIGLDMTTDSYDAGLHLNVAGAEKLSVYFGRILSEQYELTDSRSDGERVAYWQEEIARYEDSKNAEGTK